MVGPSDGPGPYGGASAAVPGTVSGAGVAVVLAVSSDIAPGGGAAARAPLDGTSLTGGAYPPKTNPPGDTTRPFSPVTAPAAPPFPTVGA